MMNFQYPLLSQLKDSGVESKVQNFVSPPGVKTRSRRSSVYKATRLREPDKSSKSSGNTGIAAVAHSDTGFNQPPELNTKGNNITSKTKTKSKQKVKDAQDSNSLKSGRNQSVKRKATVDKMPPVPKPVKNPEIKRGPSRRNKIQASKKESVATGDSLTRRSLQSADVPEKLELSPRTEDWEEPEQSQVKKRRVSGLKDDENISIVESIASDPDKNEQSPKKAQNDIIQTAKEGHNITPCKVVIRDEFTPKVSPFRGRFNKNLFEAKQSPWLKSEVEVISVVKSSHKAESIFSYENQNGENDCSTEISDKLRGPKTIEKLSDMDVSMDCSLQSVSSEDEQEAAETTFSYTGLSQRCIIL